VATKPKEAEPWTQRRFAEDPNDPHQDPTERFPFGPTSYTARVSDQVEIGEVTEITPRIVDALAGLIPQLSSSSPAPTMEHLSEIASSPATVLFVATDGERIVGSLTLAVFRIPTGTRAWIEDVVVDGAARSRGVGGSLVRAAVERATAMGARTVDLTSRPSRTEANRLYVNLGFEPRETNVYRLRADE
jgi:ribosomal protein S18 acetylase RimI-like enzyme